MNSEVLFILNKINIFVPTMGKRNNSMSIINVRFLSEVSGIDYMKIRNNLAGVYGSLQDHELTHLFNCMQTEVTKACNTLGFSYDGKFLGTRIAAEPRKKKQAVKRKSNR